MARSCLSVAAARVYVPASAKPTRRLRYDDTWPRDLAGTVSARVTTRRVLVRWDDGRESNVSIGALRSARTLERAQRTAFAMRPATSERNVGAVSFLGAVLDAPTERARDVAAILERHFPVGLRRFAQSAGVRVVLLGQTEAYRDRSRALRRLASGVDDWPVPPAGLFVVEERTVYLRSTSPMTVAHEYAHALDCALGGGVYLSGIDPRVRRAFRDARAFVTPYAASGMDEYFAEGIRSYVEANDARSPWPRATRARLRQLDPALFAIIEQLFAEYPT